MSEGLIFVYQHPHCPLEAVHHRVIESKIETVKFTKDTPTTHKKAKGQDHTKVENVHNMLSHGDTPIGQSWYAYVKEQRGSCQTQIHVKIYSC